MNDHTFALCAYGESPYLEKCILSLKRQTVKSHIIMVSARPNDLILGLADKYDIPYIQNTGETGITQDWNFAYSVAQTRYVTITHQDDIYDRTYLECMLRELNRAEHPLIGFTDYYEIRNGEACPDEKILKVKRLMLMPLLSRKLQTSVWVRRRILSFGSPICCPSVTYVKDNLPEPVFANNFQAAEDWETWERLSKLEGAFVFIPKLLMGHRIYQESTTSKIIKGNRRSEEELQILRKLWPSPVAALIEKYYSKSQDSNQLEK